MPDPIRSTTVIGAGAVGGYFGAMLAQAGHEVTLVARPAQVQAIAARGLQLHKGGAVQAIPLRATTEMEAVRGADLVLLAVKSTDTEAAARAMAPLLASGAWVVSLQNGVDNAEAIARHVPRAQVLPCAVYVATATPEPGVVHHFGRGDLVLGTLDGGDGAGAAALQPIVELFGAAQVPARISADVMGELWSKLLVNCAYNAISALAQLPYGRMVALAEVREVMRLVVHEVVAVAEAEGRTMKLDDAMAAVERIAQAMPAQLSSTAQDLARGKPTEIDHLNGFIALRGAALGVATPVNQTLHALVKLAESARKAG